MNIDKVIDVKCDVKLHVPLEHLRIFQGDLKFLDKDRYSALKASTIANGMDSPFFVWLDGDKWFILDGHQRRLVYLGLKDEGWFIPPIPCVQIVADDFEQAKSRVLVFSAKYGIITQESLAGFAIDSGIDMPFLQQNLRLAEFKVTDLGLEDVGTGSFVNDVLGGESKHKFNDIVENDFRFDGDSSTRMVRLAFALKEYSEFETLSNDAMKRFEIDNVKDLFVHLLRISTVTDGGDHEGQEDESFTPKK